MKSTGIIRRIDELGRVVLPIELRRHLGITEQDALEIYVDKDTLILRKYEPVCIFCGDATNLLEYKGKKICLTCVKALTGKKVL